MSDVQRQTLEKIMLKKTIIIISCFAFALVGLYLYQIGSLTENTYLIKKHQNAINSIANNNLSLNSDASNGLYFSNLEQKINKLDFVEIDNIKYIPIAPNSLVTVR